MPEISNPLKNNFYLNLVNLFLFIAAALTGIVLQFVYHMHHSPDSFAISGFDKSGWSMLHKISAVLLAAGIILHCYKHRKYIATALQNRIKKNKKSLTFSFYLLFLSIPVCLIPVISWLAPGIDSGSRFILIEIHDKLSLFFIIFSAVHIISRTKRLIKSYQHINS